MFPKRPMVVNSTAIAAVKARDVYCLVCGKPPIKEPHHRRPVDKGESRGESRE